MEMRTAFALEIGNLNQPVVTSYDLGRLLFLLYERKAFRGEKLNRLRKDYPNRQDLNGAIDELLKAGVLQENKIIPSSHVFAILGKDLSSSDEIACCIDPFAYVSFISAMEWHGLTDRNPRILSISSPEPKEWRAYASQKMLKDFGNADVYAIYRHSDLPQLVRWSLKKIGRKIVNRYSSKHLGAFVKIRDKNLRIATIGRTFLDMIKSPDECGGIYHVLDVYQKHAERYLQLIIDEIDRHGTKIDKVRAGYILEERLGLTHPTIAQWESYAQRGGSRKLNPNESYSPHYSEKWCLSINVEEIGM